MKDRVDGEFEAFHSAPLNSWLRVQSRPYEDGIIVFFSNITARKDAKLRETEAANRLAQVLNATSDAVASLDRTWRYTYLNANAAVSSVARSSRLRRQKKLPGLVDLMKMVASGAVVRDRIVEGELANRPGEKRAWSVNYAPIYNENGSIRAISTASIEITQQKRHSSRAKSWPPWVVSQPLSRTRSTTRSRLLPTCST